MNQFLSAISKAIGIADGPILYHTDVFRASAAVGAIRGQGELLRAHENSIRCVSGGRSTWIPVFNYDFLRTGLEDRTKAASQVGVLSEHFRRIWQPRRFGPPVFNFTSDGELDSAVSLEGEVNPFGVDCPFEQLRKLRGSVVMWGAHFSRFTGIHYIECMANGPIYRYNKLFSGIVLSANESNGQQVVLRYYVRPLGCYLDYDWDRLLEFSIQRGVVTRILAPRGFALVIDFPEICKLWSDAIRRDPLFLLDKESRVWVDQKLSHLGRRFELGDFE